MSDKRHPELEPDELQRNSAREIDRERDAEAAATSRLMAVGLLALTIVAFGLLLWPRTETNTTMSENAPRVERPNAPTTPPANKPVLPPAETPAKPTAPQ